MGCREELDLSKQHPSTEDNEVIVSVPDGNIFSLKLPDHKFHMSLLISMFENHSMGTERPLRCQP